VNKDEYRNSGNLTEIASR